MRPNASLPSEGIRNPPRIALQPPSIITWLPANAKVKARAADGATASIVASRASVADSRRQRWRWSVDSAPGASAVAPAGTVGCVGAAVQAARTVARSATVGRVRLRARRAGCGRGLTSPKSPLPCEVERRSERSV
jgi:hypothetical protein